MTYSERLQHANETLKRSIRDWDLPAIKEGAFGWLQASVQSELSGDVEHAAAELARAKVFTNEIIRREDQDRPEGYRYLPEGY